MILEDLDGDNLVGPLLPALGHLAEGAPAQELQHLNRRPTNITISEGFFYYRNYHPDYN